MMNVSGWVGKFSESDPEPGITVTNGAYRKFDGAQVPYVMLSINAGGCVLLFLTHVAAREIVEKLTAALAPEVIE